MIKYKDFEPIERKEGFFSSIKYESFRDLVERVNAWINENKLEVVSIETLIIPHGMFGGKGPGRIGGEYSTSVFQVVRVWYR